MKDIRRGMCFIRQSFLYEMIYTKQKKTVHLDEKICKI